MRNSNTEHMRKQGKKYLAVKWIILPAFLLFSPLLNAQKNAPVIGDAAQLIDLLKKDYETLDPKGRRAEVKRDRTKVIALFKSYLTDDQRSAFRSSMDLSSLKQTRNDKLKEYTAAQQAVAGMKSLDFDPGSTASKITSYTDKVEETIENLADKEKDYFDAQFDLDDEQLKKIQDQYENKNPYLDTLMDMFIEKYKAIKEGKGDAMAALNHNSALQKSIPFIGGDMTFELLVEGLSRFLANRIKVELTNYVIDKVKEWLNDSSQNDPLAEFKVILPRTTEYLKTFQANQITNFTDEIKQYIENDLNHFLEHAADLRNTPRFQYLINKHPDIDFAFEALELMPNLSRVKHPIDYFKIIENSNNLLRWKDDASMVKHNLANTLQFSSMLAHSMMILENGQPRFAGNDFFGPYASEPEFYMLYIGFLHQQDVKYYDIHFRIGKMNFVGIRTGKPNVTKSGEEIVYHLDWAMQHLMTTIKPDDVNALRNESRFISSLVTQIGKNTEEVHAKAVEIRKANKLGKRVGADTVHAFVESIIGLSETIAESADTIIVHLFDYAGAFKAKTLTIDSTKTPMTYTFEPDASKKGVSLNLREKAQPYFTVARTVNDVVLDFKRQQYAMGLLKTLDLSGQLVPKTESITDSMIVLLRFLNTKEPIQQFSNWKLIWDEMQKANLENAVNGASPKVLELKKNVKLAAIAIDKELKGALDFYKENYDPRCTTDVCKNIQLFKSITSDMMTDGKWQFTLKADHTKMMALLDQEFKRLLVSYYSGVVIDKYTESLKEKLERFETKKGIKPFSTADATAVRDIVREYAEKAFDHYVFGQRKGRIDFGETEERLKLFAKNYLVRIPETLNLSLHPSVRKLIHFVNDISLAENDEDVAKAIEAIALPSGSYSIKRNAVSNIALNSFPGMLTGMELTWKGKNRVAYGATSVGFTVPVGLSFTWGSDKGRSDGFYIPIIDVAAFTRLHLDTIPETATTGDFNFRNIFSPGLYYHHGFGKAPFSIHAGAQYGPELKEVLADGTKNFYESMFFGLGFVIDIPLFNLYTKPRFEE